MQSRRKVFLTFSLFCILPLLAVSILNFMGSLKSQQRLLRQNLETELVTTAEGFDAVVRARKTELKDLAWNGALRKFVSVSQNQSGQPVGASSPAVQASPDQSNLEEVKDLIARALRFGKFYATIAAFSPHRHLLFTASAPQSGGNGDIEFRTENLLPQQIAIDDNVWMNINDDPPCSVVRHAALGRMLRCTVPIVVSGEETDARGVLVADMKLDALVAPSAQRWELTRFGGNEGPPALVTVLDESGEIVYHTNAALKHQPIDNAVPYFRTIANSMRARQEGVEFYDVPNGEKWLAAYSPLYPTTLSLAVSRNYSLVTREARLYGWLGIILALLIGTVATVLLTNFYLRKTESIGRVAAGVDEIAKGKLDHRIELLSSDDLRPLADNVGLMTNQLRQQIAREAETRQFQSFVRLSAILTHDLKNAIEALSLIVSNMEHHFEKEEFRADAMHSLTAATDKLRALVARLSNPVNTLSGEHKRARPVDLVPILKRVIAQTAEPARAKHEIRIKLPQSLFALVDGDRLDKVIENLIINGLEAMDKQRGTLTIDAGMTEAGKPYFSISDTGAGMHERFIAEYLFRPFATTKPKGVGLGLYTCREVVNANGGTIEVASEAGAGTTFKVVLPSVSNEAT